MFLSALNVAGRKRRNLSPNLDFLGEDSPQVDRSSIPFEVAREAVDFFYSVFKKPLIGEK